MIPIQHAILFGLALFLIGLIGLLVRRNILMVFMSLELMLNSANVNLVAFAQRLGNPDGHVLSAFVITLAAAEAAVGLAILVALHRNRPSVDSDQHRVLRD